MFDLILLPLIPILVTVGVIGAIRLEASDAALSPPVVEREAAT
ncbi:MAG TPA: hypothetical protein VFZ83_07970 [Acidimicrobiia bacterium]|nr:hypothetical protein [Acidimicrobiia bacterium]